MPNLLLIHQAFYDRPVETVARELLGSLLCRRTRDGLTVGRIVETEAYLSEHDSASHSHKGMNRKNASMFGPPGHAYVYTIHARQCFNIVTESHGIGSAVLIRAIEPVRGLTLMSQRRRTDVIHDLCRGPARLCEAMSIGRDMNGWNLTNGRQLWIAIDSQDQSTDQKAIRSSIRIGVTSAHELPLRFFIAGSPFVSGPKKLNR
jgi:DNA-3-methyladenine glycosylase